MTLQEIDTTIPGPYNTLDQAKQANKAAGRHYFGPDEERFFGSQYGPMIQGRFFIETCQPPSGPRIAKVVVVHDDGHTDNIKFPNHKIGVRDNLNPNLWFLNATEARKAFDSEQ